MVVDILKVIGSSNSLAYETTPKT